MRTAQAVEISSFGRRLPINAQRSKRVLGALIVLFLGLPLFSASAMEQELLAKPTVYNLREIAKALSACMQPLAVAAPFQGMRVTIRIAFNARGQPLGPPLFTYVTPYAPDRIKTEYKNAISDALKRCTPLSFSPGLGAAIAGMLIILSFNERPAMRVTLGKGCRASLADALDRDSNVYAPGARLPRWLQRVHALAERKVGQIVACRSV